MKQLSSLFLLLVLNTGMGQNTFVYFEKNSDQLNANALCVLDSIVTVIKKQAIVNEIALYGHTDADASDTYNKALALRRAINVQQYLTDKGLKNRFYTFSKGEKMPAAENSNETEKAKNRRVEICRNFKSDNDITDVLKVEKQQFIIQNNRDTTLICKHGTKVSIPKYAFNTTKRNDIVTVNIQEFLDKSQFIQGNLTTKEANGNMLESRGMIYIEASCESKRLALKEGQNIAIDFKDRKDNDSTELFYGNKVNNEVVWQQNNAFINNKKIVWRNVNGIAIAVNGDHYYSKYPIIEVINYNTFSIPSTNSTGETSYSASPIISGRLGWINCDRFYKDSMPKTNLVINYKGDFIPCVYIVFNDINSIMSYSAFQNNAMRFNNIPTEKNIKIIALYKNANSKDILYAEKNAVTQLDKSEYIEFKRISEEELYQKLKQL